MRQKKPVVILHTDEAQVAQEIVAEAHGDLQIHTCDSYAALPECIERSQAEVVYSVRFDGTPRYPREALMRSPSVRWLSVGGSGTDHLLSWDTERLTVTNAAGVAADMMAQYALGGMLHFSLGLPRCLRAQREQRWLGDHQVAPIDDKTVLIVGLGKTGEAVAARCRALGMQILGVRARPRDMPMVDEVHAVEDLPSLLPRADFVVVCVPLLDSTRGLLNAECFAAMRPSAVLIDVSRGGVVDEQALIAALQQGGIKGAALDVFASEPLPKAHPLWALDNVLITPHCSSVSEGWAQRSVRMFSDNLARYRNGVPLHNVVDPVRGY